MCLSTRIYPSINKGNALPAKGIRFYRPKFNDEFFPIAKQGFGKVNSGCRHTSPEEFWKKSMDSLIHFSLKGIAQENMICKFIRNSH